MLLRGKGEDTPEGVLGAAPTLAGDTVWAGYLCTWRGLSLTAVFLSSQVIGLRDVLHQAYPSAWHHYRHRQLLHLPDQQEKGRLCTAGAAAALLFRDPDGGAEVFTSQLPASPFPLPPEIIWMN